MNYNLYLTYEAEDLLNIQNDVADVCDGFATSIMYATEEAEANKKPERTRIGFMNLLGYNQVLAMTYGVNLNDVTVISKRRDSKPIMELDYTLISAEPKPVQLQNAVSKETYYRHGVGLEELEKDPEKAQWKLNAFFQNDGIGLYVYYQGNY